ncbi:MAG: alpha/beta fold hydrolase [Chroococcidiopsidaceae cyanobacterium CP_BM_ER_R8_30]|nr:alpha/beta fold hydrolase [Chroococcidiopsidaceae cyanobacterium CP_BM_ER_R8_30]
MPDADIYPYFLTPHDTNPEKSLFVFLPGMDESEKLALYQVASVKAAFNVRCLVIQPNVMESWDMLCDQVIALTQAELKTVPHQSSIYLCGESFGGCLALKVMVKAPHLFQQVILVNPASSFNRRPWIHWGSLLTRWLPEWLYQMFAAFTLPFLASKGRMTPEAHRALLESVRSVPIKTSVQRLSLMRDFDLDEGQLQRFTQPVLLIASQSDTLLPSVAEAKRLSRIFPNATVVTLPHSGHACLLEADVNLYEIMQSVNCIE